MQNTEVKGRVLISVTNKTGIEKFKQLADIGWEIVASDGTGRALTEAGIPCIPAETVTGFPEMMDGRLKTLHPNIFGGILADRSNAEHLAQAEAHGIKLIDIVVVNLYDFKTKPGIENIDIGGSSLLRAAAKNCKSVTALCDPKDYDKVINEILANETTSQQLREAMAYKVFTYTTNYDALIADWMDEVADFCAMRS